MKLTFPKKSEHLLALLTAGLMTGTSQAQLVSAYLEAPTNSWVSDVATGKVTDLDFGGGSALAADNVLDRLYTSSGGGVTTFEISSANSLAKVRSVNVTLNGAGATGINSLAFANGVLYAAIVQSSADIQNGRGIPTGFYAINPDTGEATFIKRFTSEFPTFEGLDYNPQDGQLYGVAGPFKARSIFRIDLLTWQATEVVKIPATSYSSISADFDGLAVGGGKIFLTSGHAGLRIAAYDLASNTFGPSLPNPTRLEQNRGGATYFPAIVGIDAQPGAPEAPVAPTASFSELTGVGLVWSPNKEIDLDSYAVYRSSGGSEFVEIGTTTSTRFQDFTAGRGATFSYYITAIDKTGLESAPSPTFSFSVPGIPGQTLSVANIVPSVSKNSTGSQGRAVVTVVDQNGKPAASASVTVSFTGSFVEIRKGVTNSQGVATITTSKRLPGTVSFTVTVDSLAKTGSSYDPTKNVETSDRF